jgi:hypothetical protein
MSHPEVTAIKKKGNFLLKDLPLGHRIIARSNAKAWLTFIGQGFYVLLGISCEADLQGRAGGCPSKQDRRLLRADRM